MRVKFYFLDLAIFMIILFTVPAIGADDLSYIPPKASDSYVCSAVKANYDKGITYWEQKDLTTAIYYIKSCEKTLKFFNLFGPAELPPGASGSDTDAYHLTNQVIFSLACVYQQTGDQNESDRYAKLAEERRLIPKISIVGARQR